MSMAPKLKEYMARNLIEYDVITHPRTATSMETVRVAQVPGEQLAKPVVLEDDKGYLMAILPANERVHLGELGKQLNRKVRLAGELEMNRLFDDCAPGAIPPAGQAYGIEVVMDETLETKSDIFFEAGDHVALVHLSHDEFMEMMAGVPRAHFVTHH